MRVTLCDAERVFSGYSDHWLHHLKYPNSTRGLAAARAAYVCRIPTWQLARRFAWDRHYLFTTATDAGAADSSSHQLILSKRCPDDNAPAGRLAVAVSAKVWLPVAGKVRLGWPPRVLRCGWNNSPRPRGEPDVSS